jgi:hypothetical protein
LRYLPKISRLVLWWREFLLVLASLTLAYVVIEAGYRVFQYLTLPTRIAALIEAKRPASANPPYVFDAHTGYLYTPYNESASAARGNSRWRTNSHGHVSQYEYPREKPAGEYRIAVVGDSFTANITNTIRWTEVVEAELNRSAEWKNGIGGKFTRVINFGVDGMGMVQFAAMVQHYAMGFEPDLIIVNFIVEDIWRRLNYRVAPEPSREGISDYVRTRFMSNIGWFGLCPELIVATVGRFWGKKCGLPLRAEAFVASDPRNHYTDRGEALRMAAVSVRSIMEASPGAIFVQAPLLQEVENRPVPEWIGLVEDLKSVVPGLQIVSMKAEVASHPTASFFIPNDGHYSDRGTEIYAHEVARHLIERFGKLQSNK